MTKVSMSTNLNASADQVWQMIGKFNALPDWHPAVEKSELTEAGQTRTLSLVGGGKIIEKLETIDDNARTYSYSIVDSPLPVENYTATIKVTGSGDNSTIEWSSEFDPSSGATPEDAMKVIQDIYKTGFENLQKMFDGSFSGG
jgi:hypothetical protein